MGAAVEATLVLPVAVLLVAWGFWRALVRSVSK
jgi:hypothetical protein